MKRRPNAALDRLPPPDRESMDRPRNGRRGRGIPTMVLVPVLVLLVVGGTVSAAGAQVPTATADEMRQRAERLRREQRLPDALAVYQALVECDRGSFEDRFWVGKLEGWTGRLAAAESAIVQLVEERPDDYDSRIALADVRMWRGHPSAARAVLEDLNRTHSADPEVLLRLGQVSQATGDLHEARRHFARIIEIDPNNAAAREALRRMALVSRWEADVGYYGEQLPRQPATHGVTVALEARGTPHLRWRASATLQKKFDRTESRFGGELAYRPLALTELRWSAYLAPGAEVLPRHTFGLGVGQRLGSRLVLNTDYTYLDFRNAQVHLVGPGLELYAGRHWLLAGRYGYSSTRFSGAESAVGNHAGSVALGYLYGAANLLRVFAAAGAESFTLRSRDVIGQFQAHTIGGAWRHFLTPRLGFEVLVAHQDRSDGTNQDSYGLRLVQRW
jgi:YaiO family outer membrane protein